MKKILFTAAMTGLWLTAAHGQNAEPTDTVVVIDNAKSIVVTENDKGSTITVTTSKNNKEYRYVYKTETTEQSIHPENRSNWDLRLPFTKQKEHKVFETTALKGLYAGALMPTESPTGVKALYEAGITSVIGGSITPWRNGPTLDLGIGLGSKGLVVNDGMRLSQDGESLLIVAQDEGVTARRSHLNLFHLTIPVMVKQRIYKDFGISAGAILNLNTYATASSGYSIGNAEYTESYKGLNQRFFTVDLMACAGLMNDVGIYVKYSPMSMFKAPYGPEIKTIAVGLICGF